MKNDEIVAQIDAAIQFAPQACRAAMLVAREALTTVAKGSQMILVYMTGPITKGNQFLNVHRALVEAQRLRDAGFAVIVPHSTALDQIVTGSCDYERWMVEDFELISRCDALVRLPGESTGSDREVQHAISLGKRVFVPNADEDVIAQAIRSLLER